MSMLFLFKNPTYSQIISHNLTISFAGKFNESSCKEKNTAPKFSLWLLHFEKYPVFLLCCSFLTPFLPLILLLLPDFSRLLFAADADGFYNENLSLVGMLHACFSL